MTTDIKPHGVLSGRASRQIMKFRLRNPCPLLTVEDYRHAAKRAVPDMVWAFVDGAAEDGVSFRRNCEAFQKWALRQRVMRKVGDPNTTVTVGGMSFEMPILLAPTGLAGLMHWKGEVAAALAAERHGTREVVSNDGSYTLAEVASATSEHHWYQLYPWGNDPDYARGMLRQARKYGYHALMVTVDVPAAGGRETERRRGMGYPPVLTPKRALDAAVRPGWLYRFLRHQRFTMPNIDSAKGFQGAGQSVRKLYDQFQYRDMGWEDLDRIRQDWPGPMFVKGIMDAEDALRCVELGVDGIVVSNHGGRQLDGTVGTLDALPLVADAVGERLQILLDGGIRRGSDVVKALCLGATAVMIGRPYLYGLAVGGVDGCAQVLEILNAELQRVMTLMGCHSLEELGRDWLLPTDSAPYQGHPEPAFVAAT